MELPHLRLYLRRMLAMPRGLTWREALATARVRALLAVLGWVVAAVAQQTVQFGFMGEWIAQQHYSVSTQWLTDIPGLLYITLTTLGLWGVLFLAADEMNTLGTQGRRGMPDWYSTPLESWRAVLATTLAALCASAPALLGLIGFVLLSGTYEVVRNFPLVAFQLPQVTQLLLGLPAYCLACATFALALRNSSFKPYLPLLLAGSGTLLSLTQYDVRVPYVHARDSWPLVLQSPAFAPALLIAAGVTVLLALALLWCARQEDASAISTGLLFLVLMLSSLPLLRVGSDVAARLKISHFLYNDSGLHDTYVVGQDDAARCLREVTAGVWPTSFAASYRDDGNNNFQWSGQRRLTAALIFPLVLRYRLLLWLCSTLAWWCCGVAALEGARYPRRPQALAEVEKQAVGVFA